jgi:hypothetical protein
MRREPCDISQNCGTSQFESRFFEDDNMVEPIVDHRPQFDNLNELMLKLSHHRSAESEAFVPFAVTHFRQCLLYGKRWGLFDQAAPLPKDKPPC